MPPRRPKPAKKPRAKKPRRIADSLTVSVLQSTLDSTADGILVVDLKGRVVTHNPRFEEMWGLDKLGDLVGPTDTDGESFKILTLPDGRILERYSIPQRLDG